MEVVVTISLGVQAGSLALIAFGLDSIIEIFASTVVIRNLHDERRDPGDRRVHRALRLIATAFWLLAIFLAIISTRALIRGDRPDSSPLGIAYLAVTALIMFGLARLKRVTADELGSEPLQAEAGHDLPRWVSQYRHPHRAGPQRLARLVVDRRRGRLPGRRLRDQ